MSKEDRELLIINENEYRQWLQSLKQRYRSAQVKATVAVNNQVLQFYWSLGADIYHRQADNRYGTQFYATLSRDLKRLLPEAEGLSESNLKYCKRFYQLYAQGLQANNELSTCIAQVSVNQQDGNRPQVVDDLPAPESYLFDDSIFRIPWSHHRLIIDKAKGNRHKAIYYVHKTLQNNWSRAVLLNMMGDKDGNGGLYEAQGEGVSNFQSTLPATEGELATEMLRDPQNLNFITLHEDYKEPDLQRALEQHIVDLLLQLGTGFSFVGRQVHFDVAGDDFKCDLLFYHLRLRRYVCVELKVVKFQPEFVGKLAFYCSCINHTLKGEYDKDTIGLLICKEKNDVVARWALEQTGQPIGITTYELSQLLPAQEAIEQMLEN